MTKGYLPMWWIVCLQSKATGYRGIVKNTSFSGKGDVIQEEL